MRPANRVVINTGFLYGKMLITVFISLYSTRLILNALGAEDFGIFNLVGGVIVMLSFLNVSMTVTTQRYLSVNLGQGDKHKLKTIFNSSIVLHYLIAFIIVALLEIIGLFLFNSFLNIPESKISTARIVYHFLVISTFFTIIAVPYDAIINTHENMLIDAIIGIVESIIKLIIAIYLQYTGQNKLIIYALLITLLTIIIRLIKQKICTIRYEESKINLNKYFDKKIFNEMMKFAGWNTFGAVSVVAKNQGIAVILNLFFGAVVNASYGIANQVNGQLSFISSSLLKSINPQIYKSAGSCDYEKMNKLINITSKFSFFLFSILAIPLIIEMPLILKFWLNNYPIYTVNFCRMILLINLISQLSSGLQIGIQAMGKIGSYQKTISFIYLLNLPIVFIILKLGYSAPSVLVGALSIEILALITRFFFSRKLINLAVIPFLKNVILKATVIFIICFLVSCIPTILLSESLIRVICTSIVTLIVSVFLITFIGLTKFEYEKIKEMILSILIRLFPKKNTVN